MPDTYESLLSLCSHRKSCRQFDAESSVTEEEISKILQVASTSPFASGRKGWKVAAISDKAVIRSLSDYIRSRSEELACGMDEEAAMYFRRYSQSFTIFEQAPLLLVPYCRETATMKSVLRDNATAEILQWEHDNLTKSLSCVAMLILLAADSLGLGACYMTGPLLAGKGLNSVLNIPDYFLLGAIIPVGRPRQIPSQ